MKTIRLSYSKQNSDLAKIIFDLFEDKYAKEYAYWSDRRAIDDDFALEFYDFSEYWEKVINELGCKISERYEVNKNQIRFTNPDEENMNLFLVVPEEVALKIAMLGEVP